jgi:hypothetical protein
MPYEAKLPEGLPSLKIDTADPRYQALEALATREKWTQGAFSDVLAIEARRVMGSAPTPAPAAPAAAPARAAVPEGFSKMSFQEKMLWSQNNPRRG